MRPHRRSPSFSRRTILSPVAVWLVAAFVPVPDAAAQNVTFTARNGGNVATCGPLGSGPLASHTFLQTIDTHDSITLSHPGSPGPASSTTAQFDATANQTGLALTFAGTASRGGPPGLITAMADSRDNWEFTITAAMRFTFAATLTANSTEATVPLQHVSFLPFGGGAAIQPDPTSPAGPYQLTRTAPGTTTLNASGVLLPGHYLVVLFGRAEGTTAPYAGSYSVAMALGLVPAATAVARQAPGNATSFTCGLPILGQTWHANVDVGSTGHAFAVVFAGMAAAQVPIGPGFTVLIGGAVQEFLPITAGPQATYALPLPASPALAGFQLFTQAVHLGGPPTLVLSNARDLTLGF